MRIIHFVFFISLVSLSSCSRSFLKKASSSQQNMQYKQVVYYTSWSIYGRNYLVQDIPGNQVTHVNYGFANIGQDCKILLGDSWADIDKTFDGDTWDQPLKGNFNQLMKLKLKYPNIKTLISVGGWTWSTMFPTCAKIQQNRDIFASSINDFLIKYQFDGVDIDWEYPSATQKSDFTLLLQAIRQKIGTGKLLTIASSADVTKIGNLDVPAIMQSPLYVSTYDKSKNLLYSADNAVKEFITKGAVSKNLVLGAPIYGRSWANVNCNNADFGLFKAGIADSKGTWEAGVYDYKDIEKNIKTASNYHFHNQTQSSYLCTTSKIFISYEDLKANTAKCNYVITNKLGGIMYWEISADMRNELSLVSNSYKILFNQSTQTNTTNSTNQTTQNTTSQGSNTQQNQTQINTNQTQSLNITDSQKRVVVYFAQWAIYRNHFVSSLPWDSITHINYAFANIGSDCKIVLGDQWADTDKYFDGDSTTLPFKGNFNQLLKFKQLYPNVKTLISVGGWTFSPNFPPCASSSQNRLTLATSIKAFIYQYQFDGVDIDWEWPNQSQSSDFGLLMQEIRNQIGSTKLLTIASSSLVTQVDNYQIPLMNQILDWINVMDYDFHGSWDCTTNHHSALYSSAYDRSISEFQGKLNANDSTLKFISSGMQRSKIVIGAPLYGISWKGVNCQGNNYGLYESGTGDATYLYTQVKQLQTSQNYHFQEETQSAYICTTDGIFISFDDLQSNKAKCQYILQNYLGGIMFWESSGDLSGTQSIIKNSFAILSQNQNLTQNTSQSTNQQNTTQQNTSTNTTQQTTMSQNTTQQTTNSTVQNTTQQNQTTTVTQLSTVDANLLNSIKLSDATYVNLYLSQGGNPNLIDPSTGKSILHIACDFSCYNNVNLLLAYGADVRLVDKTGWSASLYDGKDANVQWLLNSKLNNTFLLQVQRSIESVSQNI